jgi:iron-only hydrogenase group A
MVKVKVNDEENEAYPDETILDFTHRIGIHVPHFCFDEKVTRPAGCRMCVVEIEGARTLLPACVTKVKEGMVIKTHSPRVLESRRLTLQLLMANHPSCLSCARNQNCKLQKYCEQLMMSEQKFKPNRDMKKDSSVILTRDNRLCIACGQCVRYCDEIQSVHAIDFIQRGVNTYIGTAFDNPIEKSVCVGCGQCVLHCPTGALNETYEVDPVVKALNESSDPSTKKHVVVQVAPSERVTISELFGYEPGTVITGKIVSALREMGFDAVFDTNFGADLTIMEEGTELLERVSKKDSVLPMITSCCPGWVKFCETFYPELLPNLSTCKSPQQMHGSIAKTYYAQKKGIDPKDIVVVSLMPCTAKKFEKLRAEQNKEIQGVDHVLTTREFGRLCRLLAVNVREMHDSEFDSSMGESTGAAALFGSTGGVMEAALRTAYEIATGKYLDKLEFDQIRGYESIKSGSIVINGKEVKFAVAHGLRNARMLCEEIKSGKSPYHFIEIMACPGGCIGGGGQPRPTSVDVIKKRIQGIYSIDAGKGIRRSHDNPSIKALYKEFLGKPGSEKAHHLLHTTYVPRDQWKLE